MSLRKLFLFTVSAVATLTAGQQMAVAADKPASENANTIEEIVVTARKREESILETPIAISALSGDDIAAQGITSFAQLADAIPGINVTGIAAGGGRSDRSFQQITLRGFVPSNTLSTLTATFIDGVPVASPTAVASVADPARVEILKGPQAAYFGRNTFAGAINVVNKLPGSEFSGRVSLMAGSRGNTDFDGSISGPLFGERFGFRIAAKYFKKDGSWDNAASAGQTLGDQETKSINLFLTANFTDNFSAKLFTLYSEDDDGPSVQALASAYELRAVNGALNIPAGGPGGSATAGTVIVPSAANCTLNGLASGLAATEARVSRPFICGAVPRINTAFTPAANTVEDVLLANSLANGAQRSVSPAQGAKGYGLVREYRHAHLNLDYKFGDSGFTLSSLTGLNAEYWSEVADLDNFDTRLLSNPFNPGNADPNRRTFTDFAFGVERETFDFSQELRLTYDHDGKFSGVIGYSYLDTTVWNNLLGISFEELGLGGSSGRLGVGKSPVETRSVFFGGTYKFTDAFRVSLEGRSQSDRVIGFISSVGTTVITPASAARYGITAGTYGPLAQLIEKTYKEFLPRVIVQYDFRPNLMAYASFSKGANIGTNTFNTAFLSLTSPTAQQVATDLGLSVVQEPEKLTNYEIGLKGKFLDDRLQLQAAIYHSVWKDQLNNRSRTFQDDPQPIGTGVLQLINGAANTGTATLQGVEIELDAKPTRDWNLGFAVAMTDSSVSSYAAPTVSQITGVFGDGFRGKQLPASSKYSANLGVQYGKPITTWDDGSWFARADFSWKDKQYLDAANLTWIEGRTVVNLRAGVKRGPLSFDAFVNNAFNDKNYTAVIQGTLVIPSVVRIAPTNTLPGGNSSILLALPELRTVGARVTYKF